MIAGTTTTMLRSGVSRSCGLQPILLRSTTCPYSTLTATPFAVRTKKINDSIAPSYTPSLFFSSRASQCASSIVVRSQSARRHASTTTSSTASAASADSSLPSLDWNTFFNLRKTRRWWQLTFSVVASATGATAGGFFLSTGSTDWLVGKIPLDPVVTLGLMTFGFAALGWLVGPSIGNQVFYLLNRQYRTPMTLKEKEFFARIKRNRVDPSNASTGNPVPDFYGEKISSVAGYRQWLKDQRAYNKKRTTFV